MDTRHGETCQVWIGRVAAGGKGCLLRYASGMLRDLSHC